MRKWLRFKCLAAVVASFIGVNIAGAGEPTALPAQDKGDTAPKVIPSDPIDGKILVSPDMSPDACGVCCPIVAAPPPPLWAPPPMLGDMFFGGLRAQDLQGGTFLLPEPGGFSRYTRISQNGYVVPTDRVFFNYNYLNGVLNGTDVNYYNAGFEKTFFNGRASLQLNVPFASTVDSIQFAFSDGRATDVEFGNISVWLKVLLAQTENFAVSAGLGVNTPTGNDVQLFLFPADPQPILRVRDDAVLLNPFIGASWTPDQRLFVQGFAQMDIDTNGSSVLFDGNSIGRLHSSTLLSIGGGIGYHLFTGNGGLISNITPMVEAHWTTDLGSSEKFVGPLGSVTSMSNEVDVVNFIGGVNVGFGERANLNIGFGTPFHGNDRQFDWQATCQLNILFGGP